MDEAAVTADVSTRAALVAAALVGIYLFAQDVVGGFVGILTTLTFSPGASALGTFGSIVLSLFTSVLPTAIGVFLALRFIAPITGNLTLVSVLVRSLVVAGVGVIAALVIMAAYSGTRQFNGSFFGDTFPFQGVGQVFLTWFGQLIGAISTYVSLLPLVALAAVLLWVWLRRRTGGTP